MTILGIDAGATDWVGIAACITALATLITAWRTHRDVQTGNGTSIGKAVADAKAIAADTNEKVSTDDKPPVAP